MKLSDRLGLLPTWSYPLVGVVAILAVPVALLYFIGDCFIGNLQYWLRRNDR